MVASNITNFFALGEFLKKDDFYLIGYHKPDGKIALLGNIFASNGNQLCTIENNFKLTSLNPENLFMWRTLEDSEIELIDKEGLRVLYAKTTYHPQFQTSQGIIATNVTELTGEFYNKNGELIARGTKNELVLKKIKGVLGATKSGGLGIVFGCNQNETDFIRQFIKEQL